NLSGLSGTTIVEARELERMIPHCRFGRLLLALLKAESDRCVVFRTMPRLILALCLLLAAAAPAAQPNFIFILADDMGYGDPEFAGGLARTPHLNRLADEGLRFTDAHTTSAVCTPTRYGIVTGRYNWRSPLKSGVLWGESEPLIPTSRTTVAKFLQDRGYATCVIGKWHLGLGWKKLDAPRQADSGPTEGPGWDIDYTQKVEGGPLALGFTHDFLYPASLDMPPYVYLRDDQPVGVPTVTKAFKTPNRPGPATADFEAEACLRDFAREARAFIGQSVQAKQPFFLYLPLTSPHTPIVPTAEWQGKSGLGDYGDFLMETDWVVGQVLAELDERGLAEDTVVVFTSDNGCSPAADIPALEAQGHYPNAPWRGHKADIFDGGHRVPFLVRWPALVKRGEECAHTVCTADFFATAADVLGVKTEIPEDAAEDSFSFLPLLEQPDRQEGTRPFVIHHSINGSFAIRQGPWKLCLCPDSGGWSDPRPAKNAKQREEAAGLPPVQLFKIAQDQKESRNLEAEEPERVQAMVDLLLGAIRNGRTTPGAPQTNEGWPKTTPQVVLQRFPALGGE
ncbi:MAG: arylsulfatase, partial [Verrucomicrobiales bacterium]|nr:arylsulfatase [Verrucomicrobiales bacterium]